MKNDESTLITVKNLNVKFGSFHALKDISFECKKGEILGMLGISGAGKSTLVRVLTGQLDEKYISGEINVAGYDPRKDKSKVLSLIGYVPQLESVNLYYDFTAIQNIQIFASLYGIPKKTSLKMAEKFLDILEVPKDTWHQAVKFLSGGEKKRVSIVMGLINDPKVLFLDEPTTGVDSSKRFDMINYLEKLNSETGMTQIIVTHDLETSLITNRVMILVDGRVIDYDNPKNLLDKLPSKGKICRFVIPNLDSKLIKKIKSFPSVKHVLRVGSENLELYLEDIENSLGKIIKLFEENQIKFNSFVRDIAKLDNYFQIRINEPDIGVI